jgi:hypothetical protein
VPPDGDTSGHALTQHQPAWDVCITTYGVYHLALPAKRRTPTSSASYHIFGMIMDASLIPLYVYTAWFAHENWVAAPDNDKRWKNIFNKDLTSTNTLLFATFLVPIVVGGLHLISLGLGLYLTILFKKIASLPHDMNPLEDNLTSRKHQYKNSEASAVSMMQKPGYMSGSTLNINDRRFSKSAHEDRTVDFRNSRVGADMDYSPHNPQSAHLSRQMTEERNLCHSLVQSQGPLPRASRQSFVQTPNSEPANPEKRDMDSFSFVGDLASAPAPPPHTSHGRSHSPRPGSSVSVRDHQAEQALYAPTHAHMQSQQKESLLSDNWFVHEEEPRTGDLGVPLSPPSPSQRRTPNFSRPSPVGSPDPDRGARFSPMLSPLPANHQAQFMPEPLRMNPPTPPNDESPLQEQRTYHLYARASKQLVRTTTNTDTVLHTTFQRDPRHDSFQEPLQKPYDSDNDAYPMSDDETSTIVGGNNNTNPNSNDSSNRQPLTELAVNRSHTTASAQSSQFAGSSVYSESAPALPNHIKNPPQISNINSLQSQRSTPSFQENLQVKSVGTPKKRQYGDLAAAMAARGIGQQQGSYSPLPNDQPPSPPKHSPYARVVSRSGADIADEALFVQEGNARRRYVSGKAAEEGMAGHAGGRW